MSEILENALDSLRMAVGHCRDQELETADKWAILEMFHAIELLLKERLHREHGPAARRLASRTVLRYRGNWR